jgi:hypothetical protein
MVERRLIPEHDQSEWTLSQPLHAVWRRPVKRGTVENVARRLLGRTTSEAVEPRER